MTGNWTMKAFKSILFALSISIFILLLGGEDLYADDTCIFMVTADDVPPNIVILLDNGAEMEQIVWHDDYIYAGVLVLEDISGTFQDNETLIGASGGLATVDGTLDGNRLHYDDKNRKFTVGELITGQTSSATARIVADSDFTPEMDGVDNDGDSEIDESDEEDVVLNNGTGTGFYHENGYAIEIHGGNYYLVTILDDLSVADYSTGLQADSGSIWTINGRTVTLPAQPLTTAVDGVIDKAARFRFTKNYLNWIYYSGEYTGDGTDLPDKSRFYAAKKSLMTVAKLTSNQAKFGIYNFTSNSSGASNVQPLGMVVNTPLASLPENNTLDPNFVNNVNNMGTVTYSPLAEGLCSIGAYYASPSSHVVGEYCQKNIALIVSPGIPSYDRYVPAQGVPDQFIDHDGDNDAGGIGEGFIKEGENTYEIPINKWGTTWFDDVSYYLNSHDVVDYQDGFQNITTYTLGFMGSTLSNLFLINASNNGNGNVNLYDPTDQNYGKFHYTAEKPDELSSALLKAVVDIINRTTSFTAPVIPVTRTISGNSIYMALFKPGEENFWEGNVAKFGITNDLQIIDADGNSATWPNGALKADARPFWATKDWSNPDKSNHIGNSSRAIYTYLGTTAALSDSSNAFNTGNAALTSGILGNPTQSIENIINYVRGADVFDEDGDGDTTENRIVITGDVLHSEPLIAQYDNGSEVLYFGANDGMLHAVSTSDGTEMWAFIPPDLLHRLKDMIEATSHQYYVDSSPKIFEDDGDGIIESGENVILVCGLRGGGRSYFALDVTDPANPQFLWRVSNYDESSDGFIPAGAAPDVSISELGESWSEPRYGFVKTSDDEDDSGTAVMFVGGGYSLTNTAGKAILAINVFTGSVVKMFTDYLGMDFSFPSSVAVVDANNNGFVDKVYIGDLGGQMWRLGRFTDAEGDPLVFPDADENINNWSAQRLFVTDIMNSSKFFYPPSVTLEKGYDLIFMGTGDRVNACSNSSSDSIYCLKDNHLSEDLTKYDLVDLTDPSALPPNLNDPDGDVDENEIVDQGYYVDLASGEKVLSEGVVFYRTLYISTFTPNDEPCMPGGIGKLYALQYRSAEAVSDFGGDQLARSTDVGGGIPSTPVMVISEGDSKLFISVGSTNPDDESEETTAGVVVIDPVKPPINFFYLWWEEL